MASKKNGNGKNATALAVAGNDALATELDELGLETDGLEELDGEDLKIAAKVLNFKGTDAAGDPIAPNTYYDTITETTSKWIRCVLLTMLKGNEWRSYNEAEGRSNVHCRSFDRENGTFSDGTPRQCKGCPDAQWTNKDGKRSRNCGPVVSLVAIDIDSQQPFVLRCKRTALAPWQQYLNRFFLGRRVVNGKRGHWPLFVFETTISAKMSDCGKYAIPTFECGEPFEKAKIQYFAESAKFFREAVKPVLQKLSDVDTDASEAPKGPSFSASDFVDDAPDAPDATRF